MIVSMADGMHLDVVNLELPDYGRGTLTIRCEALADYKAALAHMQSDARLLEPRGRMRRLQLDGPLPAQPTAFPCEVALAVVEKELPPDAVTTRMVFGNNFLQASLWVDVISLDPPTEDGSEGLLRVHCATDAEYLDLRRFVDEEHGSALRALDGGIWFVHRIDDDARPEERFPQDVGIRLEWRYRR